MTLAQRGIDLSEFVEQQRQVGRRDANPGVRYGYVEGGLGRGQDRDGNLQLNLTTLRKLDCIAEQIKHDLPQTSSVTIDPAMFHLRLEEVFQSSGARLRRHQFADLLQASHDIEPARLNVHPSSLDLGEIQDIVHDCQQSVGGFANRLGIIQLVVGQSSIEKQPTHTQDAIHGGPDLVTHVRQELALGPAGILGFRLGALQLSSMPQGPGLSLFPLADVARHAQYRARLAVIEQPGTNLHRQFRAILADVRRFEERLPALHQLGQPLGCHRAVCKRLDVVDCLVDQFFPAITELLTGNFIHFEDSPFEIHDEDSVVGAVKQRSEFHRRLEYRFFGKRLFQSAPMRLDSIGEVAGEFSQQIHFVLAERVRF